VGFLSLHEKVLGKIDEKETIEFFRELVKIPSINPPGNEGQVAEVIIRKLENLGFELSIFEAEKNRPNIIATLKGSEGKPTLLFNGHMDVFPPGPGWHYDPFGAEIVDGKIYGRTVDMKGGLASMIMAAEAVCRSKVPLKGNLVLSIVSEEMTGGHKGTGFLTAKGLLKADMGVVCEPTGSSIYIAHRGVLWLEISTIGKQAHAELRWGGINAISKMAKIIVAIDNELPPILAKKKHWILPSPTVNVGTIVGGTKVNMVPALCKIEVDRRLIIGESFDEAQAEIENIINKLKEKDKELKVEVKRLPSVEPAEISPNERIVQEIKKAYKEVTGKEPKIDGAGSYNDAHFLINQANIPTAIFGPHGDPALSGVVDEYVEIDKLIEATKTYAMLMVNVLC
jgi:acetylornithine deacetylase/succinyl-diaminopimelate desuccinylase family protein